MLAFIKKKKTHTNQNPTLCRISKIDMSFSTKNEILGRRTRAECNVNGKEKKVGNRWGKNKNKINSYHSSFGLHDFGVLLC